ncbi:hypothetical protein QWJ34_21760 [Saccharibacillus sp. CPCC 101409]|uniref:hypothetical protein n=1 Tax=Saccharibacillus sp. CPCC 101409 TaxID=3058041 RepID=UPI00267262B9|nr:hypothetical protein [Saccharibacillus sp. CPCC 101409]MDO3412406.1 hypothetical protein [Saccharibacillus sp. CPCC 101409]
MAKAWGMYADFKEDSVTDALNADANLINTKVMKTSIFGEKHEYIVFSLQGGFVLCRSENVADIEGWIAEKCDEVFGPKKAPALKEAEFVHS